MLTQKHASVFLLLDLTSILNFCKLFHCPISVLELLKSLVLHYFVKGLGLTLSVKAWSPFCYIAFKAGIHLLSPSILFYSTSGGFANTVPISAFEKYKKRGYNIGVYPTMENSFTLVITEPPNIITQIFLSNMYGLRF